MPVITSKWHCSPRDNKQRPDIKQQQHHLPHHWVDAVAQHCTAAVAQHNVLLQWHNIVLLQCQNCALHQWLNIAIAKSYNTVMSDYVY